MNSLSLLNTLVKPLRGHNLDKIPLLNNLYRKTEALTVARQNVVIEVNGYKLHLHNASGGIYKQLIEEKQYEPLTTNIMLKYLPQVNNAIDVGANIGYFTLLMSKHAKHVWAFEPEPKNFKNLLENVLLNELTNVNLLPCAVSDKEGTVKLFVSGIESGEHSIVLKRNFKKAIDVPVLNLDNCFSMHPIDLIKTDTEGNDYKVLLGAKRIIETSPQLILITEFWNEGIIASGYNSRDYWNYLSDHFEYMYIIDELANEIVSGDYYKAIYRSIKGMSVNLLCMNKEYK
jgi:FkbM family methyltransferase